MATTVDRLLPDEEAEALLDADPRASPPRSSRRSVAEAEEAGGVPGGGLPAARASPGC